MHTARQNYCPQSGVLAPGIVVLDHPRTETIHFQTGTDAGRRGSLTVADVRVQVLDDPPGRRPVRECRGRRWQ